MFILSFSKHFYLGSANIGSRGTTWTKEIGMLIKDCPTFASDAKKILDLYWIIHGMKKLPKTYPNELTSTINLLRPLRVLNKMDNTIYKVKTGFSYA